MKLNTKFTLYFAFSKLLIFGFFLCILPIVFSWYTQYSIDKFLHGQENKVFDKIRENGMEYYLQGEQNYGSYTMLKEDYIAIQTTRADSSDLGPSHIDNQRRIVESDTLNYRILHRFFEADGKMYLLEIGRSQHSISLYAAILQQVALVILMVLFLLTISVDYFYGRHLLSPLQRIIRYRLSEQQFPFDLEFKAIPTTTTDFRLLDEHLCDLMQRATHAYTREKDFTANASHELLTPISILRGKIENMLIQPDLNLELQEKLLSSLQTLDRLNGIVKTLLFLARVDSGQYPRTQEVFIRSLLTRVTEELEPLMGEKQIHLSIEVPKDLALAHQHEELLFHLFHNLINNAIVYNRPQGWINISHNCDGTNHQIIISDSGVGMTANELENLFQRFRSKYSKGNGLGMSIVKSIADFLQINIQIDSKPEDGTTVYLHFPSKEPIN
ncbi:HAMP domain-containing sensor histidine kinase [Sphingobacterium sp.]|uniref:sensor histidine kinase n=1 Tax=Sphingobacterium sp. TaxID=341027 RepID=UPI0031D1171D